MLWLFFTNILKAVILHKSMKCNHQSMCCVQMMIQMMGIFFSVFLFVCRCCCVIFKCSLLFCSRSASVSCLLYLQLLIMHRRIWYLLRLRCWGEKLGPKKMRCVNGQSRRGERKKERESQLTINCNFYNAAAATTAASVTLPAKDNFANCFDVGHTLDTINDDAASARLPLMTVQCHFFQDKWMWESAFASENDNREISNFNDCCRVILVRSFVYSEFFSIMSFS